MSEQLRQEKKYFDSNGIKRNIFEMIKIEPEWTAIRMQQLENKIQELQAQLLLQIIKD